MTCEAQRVPPHLSNAQAHHNDPNATPLPALASTAMHIALAKMVVETFLPSLRTLRDTLDKKSQQFKNIAKVAKEKIVETEDDVSADRLKNAAATKKLAIFDAFEILNKIQEEEDMLNGVAKEEVKAKSFSGFAERRSK